MGGGPCLLPRHAVSPACRDEATLEENRVNLDSVRLASELSCPIPVRRDFWTRAIPQRDRLAACAESGPPGALGTVRPHARYPDRLRREPGDAPRPTRTSGSGFRRSGP